MSPNTGLCLRSRKPQLMKPFHKYTENPTELYENIVKYIKEAVQESTTTTRIEIKNQPNNTPWMKKKNE